MTYTVRYKSKGDFFWKTIKKVKGDLTGSASDGLTGIRVLILEDETRLEIPSGNTIFEFSKDRFLLIKHNMEKEAGQKIPVNSNIKD